MILWFVLVLMVAVAVLLLVRPLLRVANTVALRPDYDLAVYREQLKDLERDMDRGTLSDQDYKNSRIEIERRILAAGSSRDLMSYADHDVPPHRAWRPTIMLCILTPICTAFLYYKLGSPTLGDQPFAERTVVEDRQFVDSEFDEAVTSLTSRLADNPKDLEGWILLARTYAYMQRFSDSVSAYREAAFLAPENVDVLISLGQSIVVSRDGLVTPSARGEFEKVLSLAPKNKVARFFLGLEREQAGDLEAAFNIWTDLSTDSSSDDLWLPELRMRLQVLAQELGRASTDTKVTQDEESRNEIEKPQTDAPGPSAADMAAAGEMTPDERSEMIRGMVERLAARLEETPNDLEGWKRLGNARRVLGELLEAERAYGRALEVDPDDLGALEEQAQIALQRTDDGLVPLLAQRNYRKILELDDKRLDALWYLGLAADQDSRTEEARSFWQALLELLPSDSPDAREVNRRLDRLGN